MPQDTSQTILLVEDDEIVARAVREGLKKFPFTLTHASTLATARQRVESTTFDAIVLDLTLPDGSGLDFCAGLRAAGRDMPVLMLTAKGSVTERVDGFRHGADDYLCKPFNVEELAARLHAILRRAGAGGRHELRFADVELDLITHKARRGDIEAELSSREAELLAYLIRHPDEVLSRERILQDVWGDEADDDSNVLSVYINYLRNKLEKGSGVRLIHTVRGVGYMMSLKEPDEWIRTGVW